MNKTELRSHLKQLRLNMSDTERHRLSQQICDHLRALDWSEVRTLHCFEPIAKLNEVDITNFVSSIQKQYPKIQLYTSRKIDGEWRIVSWQEHATTPTPTFDVVIVPMLGFDADLHRIGYGGGYYDKFLAIQSRANKVGVCFERGSVQHIPIEPHDVPLDSIVTEVEVHIAMIEL